MLAKDKINYFSHDTDMRNDLKIRGLRREFGNDGYAVWCYLLEVMTNTETLSVSMQDIELLAADFDVNTDRLQSIIDYCKKVRLLQQDGDEVFSARHRERINSVINKRQDMSGQRIRAARARWNKKENDAGAMQNDAGAMQNDANKIRIDKNRKDLLLLFLEKEKIKKKKIFETLFFRNIRNPEEELLKLIDYNNLRNRDSGGWERMTPTEQLSAARLWTPKNARGDIEPCNRFTKKSLELWQAIYTVLSENGCDGTEEMLNGNITITMTDDTVIITCPTSVRQLIESNIPLVKPIFSKVTPRKKIQYIEVEN